MHQFPRELHRTENSCCFALYRSSPDDKHTHRLKCMNNHVMLNWKAQFWIINGTATVWERNGFTASGVYLMVSIPSVYLHLFHRKYRRPGFGHFTLLFLRSFSMLFIIDSKKWNYIEHCTIPFEAPIFTRSVPNTWWLFDDSFVAMRIRIQIKGVVLNLFARLSSIL